MCWPRSACGTGGTGGADIEDAYLDGFLLPEDILLTDAVPAEIPFVAGIILAGLWISTGTYYAPLHGRLAEGYDEGRVRVLIRTNWARTAGWTVRGVLAAVMLVLAG